MNKKGDGGSTVPKKLVIDLGHCSSVLTQGGGLVQVQVMIKDSRSNIVAVH